MNHLIIVSLKEIFNVYNQQGAQLNQTDQKIDFIFGENNKYHQIGHAYLEFDITVRRYDTTTFHNEDPIRVVNNGFEFCFKEARLSTTIGSHIEINKSCAQVSTVMKAISNKNGDLLSRFDNINENDLPIFSRITDLPPQIR